MAALWGGFGGLGTSTAGLDNSDGMAHRIGDGSAKKMKATRKSGGGAAGSGASSAGAGGKGPNSKLVQTAERLMLDWQHQKESMQLGDGVRTVYLKHLTPIHTKLSALMSSENHAHFVQDWKVGEPDTKGRIVFQKCQVAEREIPKALKL